MAKKWKNKKTGIWYIRYKDNLGQWKSKYVGRDKRAGEVEALRKKYDSLEYNRAHDLNTIVRGVGLKDIAIEFQRAHLSDPLTTKVTRKGYSSAIRALCGWFETYNITRPDQITSAFVTTYNQHFIVSKELKKVTARNYQMVFIRLLNYMVQSGYYNNYQLLTSIKKIPRPKRGRVRYYSIEELQKIFKYPSYSAAFRFLYYTGLRVSELCNLKWSDILSDSNTLVLSKTKALQDALATIPLNSKALSVLSEIPRTSETIFTTTKGGPITARALQVALKKICEKEGIENGTIHTFRHTFASHLAIQGVAIQVIKELLRHSDIKMTMIYAHLNNTAIEKGSERIPDISFIESEEDEDEGAAPPVAA